MKHNIKIIAILVILFLLAQGVGLYIANKYSSMPKLPLGIERPKVEKESMSFIPVFILVLIATGFGLLLARFRLNWLWHIWFILTIWFTMTISFNVFVGEKIAIAMAIVFALLRVYRNNVIIHNFTEIFIYGALAAFLAPIFNIISVFVLLILISIYDYIAVRKTKHMVKLAKFEGKQGIFAGLMIPHKKGSAILGGGDIGFPLLFAAVVMKEFSLPFLHYKTFFIPVAVALALFALFLYGKEKKYYPAMPYVTAGCLIGYLAVLFL